MTLPQLKSHPGFVEAWRRQVSQSCPFVEPRCDPSVIYRTADGSCNNLNHSSVGAAYTRQRRMMDNSYEDGLLLFIHLVLLISCWCLLHPPTKDDGQLLRGLFVVVVGVFFAIVFVIISFKVSWVTQVTHCNWSSSLVVASLGKKESKLWNLWTNHPRGLRSGAKYAKKKPQNFQQSSSLLSHTWKKTKYVVRCPWGPLPKLWN